jgi:hypothetical protein
MYLGPNWEGGASAPPSNNEQENGMSKIVRIVLNISLKKWQFGYILSAIAIFLSYVLAATAPQSSNSLLWGFHFLGMIASGMMGAIMFVVSTSEFWDED